MKSKRGWRVLACFALAAGLTQFLWLNFAPILSLIEKTYSVTESQASLLLLVFPIIYVFLSVHAGALTDRKGYRVSLVFGTTIMALFACLRVYTASFWVLVAAQIGIAVAQPYVVNAISKLVLDWFGKEQEALATGLGTVGMFMGMALGLAVTPPVVEAYGLQTSMAIFAAASVLIWIACVLWVKPRAQKLEKPSSFWKDFKKLVKNPQLLLVFFLAFLGLGYFNGLTTWLEPILTPNGFNSVQTGMIGGMLIVGGIVGSAIIPGISDLLRRRKWILVGCVLIATLSLYPFAFSKGYGWALTLAGIQGFFFLPAFALLLSISGELAGEQHAGSATGILMLAGNAGAVIVIVAMEAVKGESPTFERAIYLLLGMLAVAVMSSLALRETLGRKN